MPVGPCWSSARAPPTIGPCCGPASTASPGTPRSRSGLHAGKATARRGWRHLPRGVHTPWIPPALGIPTALAAMEATQARQASPSGGYTNTSTMQFGTITAAAIPAEAISPAPLQRREYDGIIGDVGEARDGRGEVEWRREHEEALRPGEALELDADRTAHGAARAVGADQPRPLDHLPGVERHAHAVAQVLAALHPGAEAEREAGLSGQQPGQDPGELELLALQPKGVPGGDRDQAKVGGGDRGDQRVV